jgi:methylmalonyl-CoA epimerase
LSIERVDHVGIAVSDLARAKALYEALGLTCSGIEEVPSEKVNVAMFPVGDSRIELLESTDPEGVIGRFIAKRGEGLHHVCFAVVDLQATADLLVSRGFRLVGEGLRRGSGGGSVAFIHPSSTGGVLIELRQSRPRE